MRWLAFLSVVDLLWRKRVLLVVIVTCMYAQLGGRGMAPPLQDMLLLS